jgi:hypothetical protein
MSEAAFLRQMLAALYYCGATVVPAGVMRDLQRVYASIVITENAEQVTARVASWRKLPELLSKRQNAARIATLDGEKLFV